MSIPSPRSDPGFRRGSVVYPGGDCRARGLLIARLAVVTAFAALVASQSSLGGSFRFPTDNRALLEPGGAPRFFAPTAGRTWPSGGFGCVRSDGTRMHEGIDILRLKRDRNGEPMDEVRAAAEGEVAYVNRQPGRSNYGIYAILRHRIEGLEVFTLYAHLREVRGDLQPGVKVDPGERIGRMGRTTSTRPAIGKDRAHLHFEIDLLVNERFPAWLKRQDPKARDDHGPWNGRNLLGLDPAEVLRSEHARESRFSLLEHIRNQRELCRVLVAGTSFPWLRRYPMLIRRNPVAEREGIVAYEVSLNFNGLPFRLVPRARSEIRGTAATRLLSVAEEEASRHPCRKLVARRGQNWVLTARGQELLSLLVH